MVGGCCQREVRLVCEEEGLDGRLHSERPSLSVLAAATASCL